jgi:VIT1/CCC1 family predicted Fe2+/Mn2+ transporter
MFSRNLDKARKAYKEKNIQHLRQAHDADGAEPHKNNHGQYIKSMIYGGLDGIITTFAVVAGVAGASLSSGIVLILGFANLIADGLSMAIGDFLSTKAENEYNQTERARELWEVENYPEGEKKEMVEFYISKGLEDNDAQTVVDIISKHKKTWIDIMMVEELGIIESDESPLKNALVTFVSFFSFGFIPLIVFISAYFLPGVNEESFLFASILTGAALFILGALKVRITEKNWFVSGIEMFLVGSIAAVAAYGIGYIFSGLSG